MNRDRRVPFIKPLRQERKHEILYCKLHQRCDRESTSYSTSSLFRHKRGQASVISLTKFPPYCDTIASDSSILAVDLFFRAYFSSICSTIQIRVLHIAIPQLQIPLSLLLIFFFESTRTFTPFFFHLQFSGEDTVFSKARQLCAVIHTCIQNAL